MASLAQKRPADNSLVAVNQQAKRTRNDEIQTYKDKQLLEQGIQRHSNLFSPIMKLEGHESDIFTCEFHPDGEYLGNDKLSLNLSQFLILRFFIFSIFRFRSKNLLVAGLWRRVSERFGDGWTQRIRDGVAF